MDVLFTGEFPDDYRLELAAKGILLPDADTLYSVRYVYRDSITGIRSFLLHEIMNPPIVITHPIFGKYAREPGFNASEFTTIEGFHFKQKEVDINKEFPDLPFPNQIATHEN